MGTILGLDGQPISSKEDAGDLTDSQKALIGSIPEQQNPYLGKSRAQIRQMERNEPDMKQYQMEVVNTCQQMLREAHIPACLIAYPRDKGKMKDTAFFSINNYDLIIATINKHKEEYGVSTTEAHTESGEVSSACDEE